MATPVVTRRHPENLFADLRVRGHSGTVPDDVLVIRQDEDGDLLLNPDDQGFYHLYELGWCFIQCA